MKILVYGAGVIGRVYAAKLHEAGQDVTILARGRSLDDLRSHGVVLENQQTGARTTARVRVIDHLETGIAYDLVLVAVRKNQLASVLPDLARNQFTPNILFLVNNAAGSEEMTDALGPERVLLGFPGAGGEREGNLVRYGLVTRGLQATTLGELDGNVTPRLRWIASVLKSAGFPVAFSRNMDAWLKTHVAIVSPTANAIYLAGGETRSLARTRDGLVMLVRAVREGLRVLRQLGVPITPSRLRILEWIPEPVWVFILQYGLNTQRAELILARHANAARDEMSLLADEFQRLSQKSDEPTPYMDRLRAYLDPACPTIEEGSREIPLNMTGLYLVLGAGIATALAGWWGAKHFVTGKRDICHNSKG